MVLSIAGKSHCPLLGTQRCWYNVEVTGKNVANTNDRDEMGGEWVETRNCV